jgi:hypothetical protein
MTKKLVLLASIGALAFGVTAQAATSNTGSIRPNAPRSHSVAQDSSSRQAYTLKKTQPRAVPGSNAVKVSQTAKK